jgi:hypothetical protein
LLLIGAAALCGSLWVTRNELVFDKCSPKSILQVVFRATHWLWQWGLLQRSEDMKKFIVQGCRKLETTALQCSAFFGWPSALRLNKKNLTGRSRPHSCFF